MIKVKFNSGDHTYFVGKQKYGSVTEILGNLGCYDFSKIPKSKIDRACEKGTNVHKFLEYEDQGVVERYNYKDAGAEPYVIAWRMFKYRYRALPKVIEKPMASKVWQFAGTPDRVFLIRGEYVLVDLKTGQDLPYHELQTAGYTILAEENIKIKIKKRLTVQLKPYKFKVFEHKHSIDRSIFCGCVQVFNWKVNRKVIKL
jgi:hypothetical protein